MASQKRKTLPVAIHHTLSRTIFDDGMYVVAIVSPAMTIPQALLIWTHHQTAGLSLPTWIAYTFVSIAWLTYGVLRKQSALTLSQACTFAIDVGVVVGILTFR